MKNRSLLLLALLIAGPAHAQDLPWVKVAKDQRSFTLEPGAKPFAPWGVNYDHDQKGRLIEDYWDSEWPRVETHFARMQKMGANVVRVHLQFGKFMESADKPNAKALARLADLLKLAQKNRLYLDLTGLGCKTKNCSRKIIGAGV